MYYRVVNRESALFNRIGLLVERRYSAFAHDYILRIDGVEYSFMWSELEEV